MPPPRPAFPKSTHAQPSSHIKSKPSHSQHTERVETHSLPAPGVPVAKKGGKKGGEGSHEREVEKDRELWARLDELEREEEEYLAKERERELAVATDKLCEEKGVAKDEDKPTIRTKLSDDLKEREHVTMKVKGGSHESKQVAATSDPLRITVKHTLSQDTAALATANKVCIILS